MPLSGQGAVLRGGRFNRPGTSALYLSLDFDTAIREASQGFLGKLQPLTLCSYLVDCEDVEDLRDDSVRSRLSVEDVELSCPWMLQRDCGVEPASWRLADRLRSSVAAGIIVPSYAPHVSPFASNLVLWTWGSERHRVRVIDADGRLPVDQASWPRPDG